VERLKAVKPSPLEERSKAVKPSPLEGRLRGVTNFLT
jgi:hypothetical protein